MYNTIQIKQIRKCLTVLDPNYIINNFFLLNTDFYKDLVRFGLFSERGINPFWNWYLELGNDSFPFYQHVCVIVRLSFQTSCQPRFRNVYDDWHGEVSSFYLKSMSPSNHFTYIAQWRVLKIQKSPHPFYKETCCYMWMQMSSIYIFFKIFNNFYLPIWVSLCIVCLWLLVA